jgi:hypothetical protein
MEAIADVRFIGTQLLRAQMLDYRAKNSMAGNISAGEQLPRNIPAELLFSPVK